MGSLLVHSCNALPMIGNERGPGGSFGDFESCFKTMKATKSKASASSMVAAAQEGDSSIAEGGTKESKKVQGKRCVFRYSRHDCSA